MAQPQAHQADGIFLTPLDSAPAAGNSDIAMAMHAQARAYVRKHLQEHAAEAKAHAEAEPQPSKPDTDILSGFLKYLGY